jgi:electron transfer flavoprotein alpha subunit
MSALVIAEHDNASIRPATLNTVAAASALGAVHVLVAGANARRRRPGLPPGSPGSAR